MGNKLVLASEKKLCVDERRKIDAHINEIISRYKDSAKEINVLVADSVSMITLVESRNAELNEQKPMKRLWNELRGVNKNIRADINKNLATSQYASGRMLQKLAEQNLITLDMVVSVNHKLNSLMKNVDDEINTVYATLLDFFSEIDGYMHTQDKKVNKLKSQVENIERMMRKMSMNCMNCNEVVKENQFLCYNCGEILEMPGFDDDKMAIQFKSRINELSGVVRNKDFTVEYMWDETVAKYARTIEHTKRVLSTELMSDMVTNKMFRDMDNMLKRCKSAEFHIALVGTIKAGKSTLINAILGSELTPPDRVTPETASLTKFRSSKDSNYVKVTFYKNEDWNKLWKSVNDSKAEVFLEEYSSLNAEAEKNQWLDKDEQTISCDTLEELKAEIEKWTSSKSPMHYFVREVEVGLKDFNMPPEVIFVDTPGLDDVVQYRSDITRDYIDRANAVLVCVKSDSLSGQEMGTIYSVFANTRYNPQKVYIVATQLDTLNNPEKNWQDQRQEWLKYLKRSDCYGTAELASKNLIPVSGYLYTLIREFDNISDEDDRYWSLNSILPKFRITMDKLGENSKRLIEFTGVDLLKRKLNNEVVSNYKTLLIDDIKENYILCKDEISDLMVKIKKNQIEIIETTEKGIEEIEKKSEEYSQKVNEISVEKKEMEKLLKTIRIATTKRVDELTSVIKGMGGIS